MTKRCMSCGQNLDPQNFTRHNGTFDGLAQSCRDCNRRHKWQSRMNSRAEIHAIFGSKCVRCGDDRWQVLEIDHVYGGGSADRIAGLIDNNYSRHMIEYVRANQGHFQLLCANCHRIKTWEDRDRERAAFPPIRGVDVAERKRLQSEHGRVSAAKRWAARSPEQRTASAVKGGATRRAHLAHCKHGHPFDEANTHVTPTGVWQCRTCARERMRGYRAAKRATSQG